MLKVFLVDDEPFILEGLCSIVDWEQYGLEIAGQAQNGEEALFAMETLDIDILITDISMPKINGLELIREVIHRNKDIKFIILSGYNEFGYVKEGIKLGIENYLLKPINLEELKQTLHNTVNKIQNSAHAKIMDKNLDIIRDNILMRWVNRTIDPKELLEKAKMLQINLGHAFYVVAVLRFCYLNEEDCPLEAQHIAEIGRVCKQSIQQDSGTYSFIDLDGDFILMFALHDRTKQREAIHETIGIIKNKVHESLHVQITVTIGSVESTFLEVNESYKNAKNLQEYYFQSSGELTIDYELINRVAPVRSNHLPLQLDDFAAILLSRNKDEAFAFMDDSFTYLQETKGIKPSEIQNLAVEFILQIKKVGKRKELDYKKIFSHIFKIRTIEQLKDHLRYSVDSTIDSLESVEGYGPIITRTLKYVDEHYHEELSLKTLSRTLNMNSIYLGQLFLQEMRVTFSDYVNKYRIEKAKQLLLKTMLKVNDIANKVGYIDATYFFRKFKKVVGVSPLEFRQREASQET
jgi:two-component system response regulator YesN